jgi:hypothetical protein
VAVGQFEPLLLGKRFRDVPIPAVKIRQETLLVEFNGNTVDLHRSHFLAPPLMVSIATAPPDSFCLFFLSVD